jgi:hypothetical protein
VVTLLLLSGGHHRGHQSQLVPGGILYLLNNASISFLQLQRPYYKYASITNVNYIAYGKLPLILLSRSDSKQIEWVPLAPLLYKKRQVRAQVFGFPVTHDDLRVWAEKHPLVIRGSRR